MKKPRPKAYSYVRFSTPEQAEGDSLRRQTEKARHYAKARGLELDEKLTFRDLGISAHHGRNAADGQLGTFLDCVRDGRVPQGSYLLVESLDRISRETMHRAARTIGSIIDVGVTVVDLSDNGRVYNTEVLDREPTAYLMMVMRFMRAHEESALKGTRVAAAFERKRVLAAAKTPTDRPFTRMLPGWLRWSDKRKCYEAIPERAKIVREIFRSADDGEGQHAIAHNLNARGVDLWGTGKRKGEFWHRSYVRKLLSSRAVLGTFTPHKATKDDRGKRVRKPLDAIANYWPAVVDVELFERVNARMRSAAPRGRNAGSKVASIFAGVLKCHHCGGAVVRVSKGEYIYLICAKAHAKAGCKYQAVPYRDVAQAMTVNAQALCEDAPRGVDTVELEKKVRVQEFRVDALLETTEQLVDELARNNSDAVRLRLKDKEAELQVARDRLRSMRGRIETQAAHYVRRRLTTLRDCLKQRRMDVSATNSALKAAVSKIVINPEAGSLTFHWHHSDAVTRGPVFATRHFTAFRQADARERASAERGNVGNGRNHKLTNGLPLKRQKRHVRRSS